MNMKLAGHTAIVLASSKGLGFGAAKALAMEGANVTLVGRNQSALDTAAERIEQATGNLPLTIVADITKAEDIKHIISATIEAYGTVHILINNCGGPAPGTFDMLTDEAWQQGFELTLLSYVRAIRAVLPYMREQKYGRIINLTSSSHKQPIEALTLSSTFRVGVLGLAKTLAPELAEQGILINTIGPGRFSTERIIQLDQLNAEKQGITREEQKARELKQIPLGRYGGAEELGHLIAFLASPVNSYVTGQALLADGGMVRSL